MKLLTSNHINDDHDDDEKKIKDNAHQCLSHQYFHRKYIISGKQKQKTKIRIMKKQTPNKMMLFCSVHKRRIYNR